MKNNVVYVVISFFMIMLFSCSHKNDKRKEKISSIKNLNYQKKNFDSLMTVIIDKFSSGLDFSEALLTNKAFLEIYDHAPNYLDDVIQKLTAQRFSVEEASYSIYAMQNLSTSDYCKLCRVYVSLFREKRISEGMLESVITPNFLGKKIIAENYQKADVRLVLIDIQTNCKISNEFNKIIGKILAGEYL